MDAKAFGLAWIVVSDFDKAKKFFKETLGMNVSKIDEEHGWMECTGSSGKGAMIGVAKKSSCTEEGSCPIKVGSNAVITLTVDDIVKSRAELEKKGVKLFGEISEVPGHVKLQTFADPDGNIYQLVQLLGEHK